MTQTAKIVETLRPYYNEGSHTFDFKCSMFLAGKSNEQTRVEIIKELTGHKPPKSKASLGAVVNALKNTYDSPTLF